MREGDDTLLTEISDEDMGYNAEDLRIFMPSCLLRLHDIFSLRGH